jgi:cytochrome b6-f complex iron-sulfur subunit
VGIALAIVGVVVLAVLALMVTAGRRATTGRLSRETVRRDLDAGGSAVPVMVGGGESVEAVGEEARARADEARRALESGSSVPARTEARAPVKYEPVDEEQLGVTRRQFLNRGILTGMGLGVGAFGVASLAFLWPPTSKGGFGGKITVGSTSDANDAIAKGIPFYNAGAKTYITPYPKSDVAKAKKVAAYTAPIIAGMDAGYVALYQRCVHLGCRVPWCQSSQWFECPCHGSKYNRVGEKRAGPAPRGLDRFVFEISGGDIVVDTGNLVLGPPIGTDTTGQSPEGPLCV